MDDENLKKLEEKLYSQAPFIGDRIRKQAAKELLEMKTPQGLQLLIKAFIFSEDENLKNQILSGIRQLKIQDTRLIDVVCQGWKENRDIELSKLLKVKGWVASKPLELRILTALNLGWQGIIEEQGETIVAPLLKFLQENDPFIQKTAEEWLNSFTNPQLQEEVCRLASEEDNQEALQLATQCGYTPSSVDQAALFCYLTKQWDKYQEIDPDYHILSEFYYNTDKAVQERIDNHGKSLKRVEWLWIRLGGKDGKYVSQLTSSDWEKIIKTLAQSNQWELLWSLKSYTPLIWTKVIIEKLATKRLSLKNAEIKQQLTEFTQLFKNLTSDNPPKGSLVRCAQTINNHSHRIEGMVVTPDSKILITTEANLVNLWSLATGELINTLKGHIKGVTTLAISGDGSTLAVGSRDKTVSLWRLPEGRIISRLSANVASVWSLAMTEDGKLIASASYQEIRLWQFPPGRLFKNLRGFQREVEKVIIPPGDRILIGGGGVKDNSVRVWNLPEGDHLYNLLGHKDAITDLAVSQNGEILASASKDNTVKLWSLATGKEICTLKDHLATIWCVAITPDSQTVVSASEDGNVKLWSINGELKDSLVGHQGAIFTMAISYDGSLLVTGGKDKTVRLWNLNTQECINVITDHQDTITKVCFTQDRQTLITVSADGVVKVWRWDLSRLCYLSPLLMTSDDKQWLENAFHNDSISHQEKEWITLLQKLAFPE